MGFDSRFFVAIIGMWEGLVKHCIQVLHKQGMLWGSLVFNAGGHVKAYENVFL